MIALTDYNKTLELLSIVDDKLKGIICLDSIFDRNVESFLKKLNNDDKQLTIKYLNTIFPKNSFLNSQQQQLNSYKSFWTKSASMIGLNDYGLQKNMIKFKLYSILENIRMDENKNWKQLNELILQKEFFDNSIFPISLMQYKSIIEKLKKHSWKIIDLIESCKNSNFQLNSTILKNLTFFFFLPDDLQINSREQTNLYIILGEILSECWLQFEYHVQQLQIQEPNSDKLNILQSIPKLLQSDQQKIKDSINQIFRSLLKKDEQTQINYAEIDYLIEKLLPINFDFQVVFYQMCFLCFQQFNYQYKKNFDNLNQKDKLQLLNQYILLKIQSQQLDKKLIERIKLYNDEQIQFQCELKILSYKSIEELLSLIIEEDFHQLNKGIHIMRINNQNQQNVKILNLLTEIPEEDKRKVATLLKQLIKEKNIINIASELQKLKDEYPFEEIGVILRILCEYQNQKFENYQIIKQALKEGKTQVEMENLLKISKYDENMELDQQIIVLQGFKDDLWELIQQNPIQYTIANSLISKYLEKIPENSAQIFQILRRLCTENSSIQPFNNQIKLFSQLFALLQDDQIHYLIKDNKSEQISNEKYSKTIEILFLIFKEIQNEKEYQDLIVDLEQILKLPKIYCLNFLIELIREKQSEENIQNIYKLVYSWQLKQKQNLKNNAELLYRKDANFYKQIFAKIQYFDNEKLHPNQLEIQLKSDIYPRSLNVSLEKFNISLTLLNKKEQQDLVANWIKNVKDQDAFEQLIPFFFNIIKRGESSASFLSIINQQIKANRDLQTKYGYFNQKSIFQIFYNNANEELKVVLLKLMSKQHPIPLLYRTPYNPITEETEKLTFNINSFYVFQQNFPIINLSLDENQKRIGKTELINKIFYQQYKFEISDNNQLNRQTIDIMYDFEFSGSRNLSIADAHNCIPLEILDDILPMFKLWIIQLDTEKEIEINIKKLEKLEAFNTKDKVVCFLIRNSKQEVNDLQIKLLEQFNIKWKQVIDLSDNDLNKQMKDDEIEQVSKFLFEIIEQSMEQLQLKQEQYFNLICQMKHQDLHQTKEMKLAKKLFQEIEEELNLQMKHEQGFYNEAAFPLRSVDWQIKQEKDKYIKLQQNNDQKDQTALNEINKNISNLQAKIKTQKFSKLILKFCELLQQPNYYILYLQFVDNIRKFNEKNTYDLQNKNQLLSEKIQKLKKEKEAIKPKENAEITIEQREQRDNIQKQIEKKILKLKRNQEVISKINIGIELFWREIIQQIEKKCNNCQIEIDPAKIVKEMISKGEPYEFLDGDQLRIDQQFLMKLISNFSDQGQEKILVLSVLGPQSSGKSTILNKIFGCHFWTSVGRCTKGIYLQLLKIHNKAFFNNLFDYIIILDSEGLQSPSQDDQEFDKKIALFVLSISDIILVNVKGDITQQFKSLVEMCIFTLGQMKSFTNEKQITWCFNQNNDVNNHAPFLQQLQSIATSLSTEFSNQKEENEAIDYNDILGITKDNIKILGFASTEELWRKNENNGIYSDWRQLKINGTFSEEAYEYGIRVIRSYVQKFGNTKENDQQRNKQMENLKSFIEKIELTWYSIQNLPDLLEFSELIQHQQNLFMRQQFDQLISEQKFPNKNEYIKNITERISEKNLKLTLEILDEIQLFEIKKMNGQFDSIKNEFNQKLTSIKNEKKISKKVFTKYVNMLKDRINSEKSACNLAIYAEIKTQETILQKKKGFIQLDQFILNLIGKEDELKYYKEDEGRIKEKFDQLWGSIVDQHTEQQEAMFKEFCDKLLQVIQQEFSNYILKSKHETQYKQEYHNQKLLQRPPLKEDYLKSLQILSPELQTQQFMVIENSNKNYQFYETFVQSINNKLKKCSDQSILQINKFYKLKVLFKWINLQDFHKYMQNDMLSDLEYYYSQNKRLDKYALRNFFDHFTIFGFEIVQENVDKLYDLIKKWISWEGKEGRQQLLLKCFSPVKRQQYYKQVQYDLSIDLINKTFKGFAKYTLSQELVIQISDSNNELDNLIQTYNQSDDIFLVEILEEIILDQKTLLSQGNREVFNYILNQKANYHLYYPFRNNVVKIIQQLMNEHNQEGWNKMYCQINELIFVEMIEINKDAVIQQNENVKVNQYSFSLIKRIMSKIEQQIKQYNKQFSNFGVMLNDIGERCLFYYSIFTIWRFLCFGQYQSTEQNIKELKDQTSEQYLKFKADIQQNKKEQSKIRGITQATDIINVATQRLYVQYSIKASQIIKGYSQESSFDIIKQLDKDILEKSDKNITDDQIVQYIRNQTFYVEKYVKDKVAGIKQEIQTKLTNDLRGDLKSHIQKVDANTKNLHGFVTYALKAQDYFISLSNPDEAPGLLYKIVLSCLEGKVEQRLLEQIQQDKRDAFQTQDFHVFDVPLCTTTQKSDAEIQILLDFINAFENKIKEAISNLDQIHIDFEKLKVQADLDTLQLKQIGCLEYCPICKRKCDEAVDDSNHKHQCKNGHQLRGMSGVLIGCQPSLYTCEEIQDDFQIQELETQQIKKWKDIKSVYNTWQFSCLDKTTLQLCKEKFMKIWNDKIGRMICEKLSKEIGKEIFYIPKQEVQLGQNQGNQKTAHYILILDDSGSMGGRPFESAKQGLVAFLYEIQKNPSSRVTIIIFNSNARCTVDYQIPNPQTQSPMIVYNGGGTNFDAAFLLAYEKISQNPHFNQFNTHSIFFYTDGGASYPSQALAKFQQLPTEKRQKIELIACSEESSPSTLIKVVEFFKSHFLFAKLQPSMQPEKIAQIWIEEVSKVTHQIKNC